MKYHAQTLAILVAIHISLWFSIGFTQWDWQWYIHIPEWESGERGVSWFIFACINFLTFGFRNIR